MGWSSSWKVRSSVLLVPYTVARAVRASMATCRQDSTKSAAVRASVPPARSTVRICCTAPAMASTKRVGGTNGWDALSLYFNSTTLPSGVVMDDVWGPK
eukprot:scaffold190354_cov28-Attheya_sp.AAC.1